ncbi:MAG: holo-ACP synthase [Burkholderiaceae bacterium]|jgi:holo-[acyl-carrier protein] synthase
MIVGIGTDLVEIERIADSVKRLGEAFISRILAPSERVVFQDRSTANLQRGIQYLATRFAAKEAFSKACRTGMRDLVTWQTVFVLNDSLGAPYFCFEVGLQGHLDGLGWQAQLSLSDTEDHAVAFVVITRSLLK